MRAMFVLFFGAGCGASPDRARDPLLGDRAPAEGNARPSMETSIATADVFFTGPSTTYGYLGYRIETGDFDADGVADLIAGADYSAPAQAYVAFGPMTADTSTDDADVAFRNDSSGFITSDCMVSGDADGDGYDDILFSSHTNAHGYLFLGPVTSDATVSDADLALTGTDASMVVQILGDHDGDGTPDIAARALDYSLVRRGTVYVASGAETGTVDLPAHATYSYNDHGNDEVGAAIVSLGDATGDGIDDVAIGDPGRENHAVYVVPGGLDPGDYSLRGVPVAKISSARSDRFGETIAATDYDGDGYTDMLVGATKPPGVRAFFGPFSGDRKANDAEVRWTGARSLGYAIAADGDVDADGQPDLLFGAPYTDVFDGTAYLQIGAATGVVDVASLVSFTSDYEFFGYGVAFVPDWTGDGGSEVALGDIGYTPTAGDKGGRVAVFFSEAF